MELYIHFGIYKAGSSFLQYICANCREELRAAGICFPNSEAETKMKLGLISPGNGEELMEALAQADPKKVTHTLLKWKKEAQDEGCDRILVSAEGLVHQMAKVELLKMLEEGAEKAGITNVKAMGFFRDLLSHALSTYKHRATSGTYPDYKEWLESHYETPALLDQLFTNHQRANIDWTFRKFKKDTPYLFSAFFVDWLEMPVPSFTGKARVNESLTLSEIIMVSEFSLVNPQMAAALSENYRVLNSQLKYKDPEQEAVFYTLAREVLKVHNGLIEKINQYFVAKEKMNLLPVGVTEEDQANKVILSPQQVRLTAETLNEFSGVRGVYKSTLTNLKKMVPVSIRKEVIRRRLLRENNVIDPLIDG